MKKIKNKEELLKIIKNKLLGSPTDLQDFVMRNVTVEGRLTKDQFLKIMSGENRLETIREEVLIWIALAIEKFNQKLCKSSDYFTDIEITNARLFSIDEPDINEFLTFHGVSQLAPNQYSCIASVYQIGVLREHNILKAIPDAQRDSKIVNVGDEILRVVKVNPQRVKTIQNLICNDTYIYDDISLNLENNGGLDLINYNEEDRTITISKDNLILVLDGNHRSVACEWAVAERKDLIPLFKERYFGILFTNASISDAKDIVAQKWNREPITKRQQETMTRSIENIIVDMIKADNNADHIYSKNIVNTGREIAYGNGFILFEALSTSISNFYDLTNIKTQTQRIELKNWLVEFFNELTNIFVDDFVNFKTIKKDKWNVVSDAWYVYVYISKLLQNDSNWKIKLRNILSRIDWDKKNNPFKSTSKPQQKTAETKKVYTKIIKGEM